MTRILFSVHVGDSIAHVLRTREAACYLVSKGHEIMYSVPGKASRFLDGYLDPSSIFINNQNYSYAQMPLISDPELQFLMHGKQESYCYREFKPEVLIGDTGLVAFTYAPDIPLIKILDRFYLEISDNSVSPYDSEEKALIRWQTEELVNYARHEFGISAKFSYSQFVENPVFLNGASYFVEDLNKQGYENIGSNMRLSATHKFKPVEFKNCLVLFGTGMAVSQVTVADEILKVLEGRFDQLYVAYGTNISYEQIYHPSNAIMKPIFDTVPEDVHVLVCHGGSGATHLGFQLNVPILVTPFQIEQFSNAYHIERLGLGLNLGTYERGKFKGLYQSISIDWNKFYYALDHISSVRKNYFLTDHFVSKNHKSNQLTEAIENFLLRSTE